MTFHSQAADTDEACVELQARLIDLVKQAEAARQEAHTLTGLMQIERQHHKQELRAGIAHYHQAAEQNGRSSHSQSRQEQIVR